MLVVNAQCRLRVSAALARRATWERLLLRWVNSPACDASLRRVKPPCATGPSPLRMVRAPCRGRKETTAPSRGQTTRAPLRTPGGLRVRATHAAAAATAAPTAGVPGARPLPGARGGSVVPRERGPGARPARFHGARWSEPRRQPPPSETASAGNAPDAESSKHETFKKPFLLPFADSPFFFFFFTIY